MKFLIWFLTLTVLQLLNAMLGAASGVQLGPVPVMVIWFFLAGLLCKKWEKRA